jgi:hypothetical protein
MARVVFMLTMAQKSLAPEQEHTEAGHPGWHPRWWFCGTFVVLAAIQLSDGWSTTDAIGPPARLRLLAGLVFVRRLPGWVTGEWSPRPWSRLVAGPAQPADLCAGVAWLPAVAVVDGLIKHHTELTSATPGSCCSARPRWARWVQTVV